MSWKCIFYSNTSKAYCLFDEVNKKFILCRDVIFLESSKTGNVVKWWLDHLEKIEHEKSSQEFDNEIPHLKGGIPILDQFMDFPYEAFSTTHEVIAIDQDVTLRDVIMRNERLNIDSNPCQ